MYEAPSPHISPFIANGGLNSGPRQKLNKKLEKAVSVLSEDHEDDQGTVTAKAKPLSSSMCLKVKMVTSKV